jgi:general secretion pathway protein C
MTPRQAALAVDIFLGAVVVSVAIALAGLTWRLAGLVSPEASPLPVVPGQAQPAIDTAAILALAPFGRADESSAQPTGLALELRGVLLANPRSSSSALIAPQGGTPVSYTVGQAIPGGVLEAIAIDYVLLRANGRLERLGFPQLTPPIVAPPTTATSSVPGAQAVPPTGPSDGTPMQVIAPSAPPAAAPSGQSLLSSFGAAPVAGGYRIGTEQSPAAQRAGLLPGDIIERVNGAPVGNAASDQQVMASAMAAGSARIDVLRGGRRITLSFPLR